MSDTSQRSIGEPPKKGQPTSQLESPKKRTIVIAYKKSARALLGALLGGQSILKSIHEIQIDQE